MANDPASAAPNPLQRRDAGALIGIVAVIDGAIWGGSLDDWTTGKIAERLVLQGLLTADYNRDDVHQALDDLNQRLHYVAGDYESPPPSVA